MSNSTDQPIAADLETAVRAVPGVSGVFRTGGILSKLVGASAEALGDSADRDPLVRCEHGADGTQVEVAIGVRADAGAAETAHRTHAAISALCSERGLSPIEIRLTVVHIDEDPAPVPSR